MLDPAAHRLRTTRWIGRAPRLAVIAAGLALASAGVRSTIDSPAQAVRATPVADARDVPSEALAEAFTRDYLTWDATSARDQLASYGPEIEPASVPTDVTQSVRWTTVVAASHTTNATTTITVLAETSRGRYALALTVARGRNGVRQIVGQPALVGALPVANRSTRSPTEHEVDDQTLTTVAERAVRNYLAHDRVDLAADLTATARVVLPDRTLDVRAVDAVTWVRARRRVAVAVRAIDRDRVEMSLRYELAVTRQAGRWLVRAINTNPEVQ